MSHDGLARSGFRVSSDMYIGKEIPKHFVVASGYVQTDFLGRLQVYSGVGLRSHVPKSSAAWTQLSAETL